jgi:hypothetical protein
LRINGSTGAHGNPSHSPRAGTLIPFSSFTPSSCDPVGALAQWGYTDHPNPGLPNDTLAWRLTVSNDTFCSPSTVTFTLEVFNFQHVSDNADLLSGACDVNIGSYVMAPSTDPNFIPGPLNAQTWTTYSFDKTMGITTLTYTSGILPVGAHCYTLQWDDYSNCCGSTSKTSQNECYERELVCVTVFAPLSYDCNEDDVADVPQLMCTIDCSDGDPAPGIINASKYITGGGNVCYILYDSLGILPSDTNNTGVFLLPEDPNAGGYYVKIYDKSGCVFDTLFIKVLNNCEKAPVCPTNVMDSSSTAGYYCPNDTLFFCVKGTNLPMNGLIEYFIGPFNCSWTPGDAGTTKIGDKIIEAPNCETCPTPLNLNPSGTCGDSGGLIINEFSQGQGTNREWLELLVVGKSCGTININGWIINDNDGVCGTSGNAAGYIWFDQTISGCNCDLTSIPVGSRIIIYNEEDREPCLPADDSCDANGDKIYVFRGNHPCLSTCYNSNTIPCPTASINPGGTNQGWQQGSGGLLLGNSADCMITRCPDGNLFHGVEYGSNCGQLPNPNIKCASGTGGSSSQTYSFQCGNFFDSTNFRRNTFTNNPGGTACTVQTPGLANNADNQKMINRLCGIDGICFVEPLADNCLTPPPLWYCLNYVIPQEFCPADSFCVKARITPLSTSCTSVVDINKTYIIKCPSADIKGAGIDTCLADLPGGYDIPVMVMNGVGPYKLCWSRSDVGTNTCVTGAGPNFTIHIDGPTDGEIKIKLDSVVDLGGAMCPGELDGDEICVNIRPTPTITVATHTDITSCATGCGSVTIEFEGTGPYMFSYCVDGGIEVEVFVADNTYVIEACVPGVYTIKSFADDFGCGGTILKPKC